MIDELLVIGSGPVNFGAAPDQRPQVVACTIPHGGILRLYHRSGWRISVPHQFQSADGLPLPEVPLSRVTEHEAPRNPDALLVNLAQFHTFQRWWETLAPQVIRVSCIGIPRQQQMLMDTLKDTLKTLLQAGYEVMGSTAGLQATTQQKLQFFRLRSMDTRPSHLTFYNLIATRVPERMALMERLARVAGFQGTLIEDLEAELKTYAETNRHQLQYIGHMERALLALQPTRHVHLEGG